MGGAFRFSTGRGNPRNPSGIVLKVLGGRELPSTAPAPLFPTPLNPPIVARPRTCLPDSQEAGFHLREVTGGEAHSFPGLREGGLGNRPDLRRAGGQDLIDEMGPRCVIRPSLADGR